MSNRFLYSSFDNSQLNGFYEYRKKCRFSSKSKLIFLNYHYFRQMSLAIWTAQTIYLRYWYYDQCMYGVALYCYGWASDVCSHLFKIRIFCIIRIKECYTDRPPNLHVFCNGTTWFPHEPGRGAVNVVHDWNVSRKRPITDNLGFSIFWRCW